jgi:hypothetical protein
VRHHVIVHFNFSLLLSPLTLGSIIRDIKPFEKV